MDNKIDIDTKYNFDYLIEKLRLAGFNEDPFSHVYIEDFFSKEHFNEIVNSPEIVAPKVKSDEELFSTLFREGYKIIQFPGCITDKETYIKWHGGTKRVDHHSACEGFGMTMRLVSPRSAIIKAVKEFIESKAFNKCLAEKFNVSFNDCNVDSGIQKYFDGYEISPHPDVRNKASTFMVNINPNEKSEDSNHHTHYLKLKSEKKYIQTFWEGNKNVDRGWIPWEWCETVKQQTKNNSIVIFSPSDDTMHGVKADYNHLVTQRTQLYGNLWFKDKAKLGQLSWEEMELKPMSSAKRSLKKKIFDILPESITDTLRKVRGKGSEIEKQKY